MPASRPFILSRPFFALAADYRAFRTYAYSSHANPPSARLFRWLWVVFCLLATAGMVYTSHLSFKYDIYVNPRFSFLVRPVGVWETLKAVLWMASATLMFITITSYRRSYRWGIGRFGGFILALLALLVAGEEVNWGQDWFGFATPEGMGKKFCIRYLVINGVWLVPYSWMLFNLSILLYVFIFPILGALFFPFRYLFHRLGIPLVPLVFVPFAIFLCLLSDAKFSITVLQYPSFPPLWDVSDFMEALFALIVTGTFAVEYFRRKEEAALR